MAASKPGKPDLNEASREELVEVAGLKPDTADTIVKLRSERGPVESVDKLRETAKLGEEDVGKLQQAFQVAGEAAQHTSQEVLSQGTEALRRVGETARDLTQRGTETAQRIANTTQQAARTTLDDLGEASRQMDGMVPVARVGMLWLSFWPEQAAQTVSAVTRLMQCRSFPEAVQVQSEFTLGSINRLARCFTTTTELVGNQADRLRNAA
jgi:hypothetical protein